MERFSPYWIWFLLAIPAFGMAWDLMSSSNPRIFHILVHPSGEFSARFLIIAMMATPLCMLFKDWRGPRWLMRNRRYFGVAAFAYAALHTVFYLLDKGSVETVIRELPWFYIWTGWVAFAVLIPLAATSMDYFVRVMGPNWKRLQRWTYLTAVLTLLHWVSLHNWGSPAAALVHFGPLAVLEAYRIWHRYLKPRGSAASQFCRKPAGSMQAISRNLRQRKHPRAKFLCSFPAGLQRVLGLRLLLSIASLRASEMDEW